MIELKQMVQNYTRKGYSSKAAEARVCQDIVLLAIERGSLGKNVTIKGGVVMRSITGNIRRATEDMDLDFIRYSLADNSIKNFVAKLNCLNNIQIKIKDNLIEPLSQQEYNGKRIHILVSDSSGYFLESKLDLGVHTRHDIKQIPYCFDVCMDENGVSLLINSCEQIYTEKLRSLLRFGPLSTRYKDIFDMYYLQDHIQLPILTQNLKAYIIDDTSIKESNIDAILQRVTLTFSNKTFRNRILHSADKNWLQIDIDTAFSSILEFLTKYSIYFSPNFP